MTIRTRHLLTAIFLGSIGGCLPLEEYLLVEESPTICNVPAPAPAPAATNVNWGPIPAQSQVVPSSGVRPVTQTREPELR